MFKDYQLHPVWTEENKSFFVDSDIIQPVEISYEDERKSHLTSFLKLGTAIDLDEVFTKPVFGEDPNIQIEFNNFRLIEVVGRIDDKEQILINRHMGYLPQSRFLPSHLNDHLHILNVFDFLSEGSTKPINDGESLSINLNDIKSGFNVNAIINRPAGRIIDSSAYPVQFKDSTPFNVIGYSLSVTFIDTNRFR